MSRVVQVNYGNVNLDFVIWRSLMNSMYQYEIRYQDIDFLIHFNEDRLCIYLDDFNEQKLILEGKIFVLDNLQDFFKILDDAIAARDQEIEVARRERGINTHSLNDIGF